MNYTRVKVYLELGTTKDEELVHVKIDRPISPNKHSADDVIQVAIEAAARALAGSQPQPVEKVYR